MAHDRPDELDDDTDDLDDNLDDLDDDDDDLPPPPKPVMPVLTYGPEIGEHRLERPEWLWEPYLAFGALSVLDGDPGVGKSLLTIDVAARLGTRRDFPDGRPAPTSPVNPRLLVTTIFVSAEDSVRRTIMPRIAAAGGNPNLSMFVGGVGEDSGRALQFPRDVVAFCNLLREHPGSFVVLDPMMALFSKKLAAGSDQAVREVLTPLARAAAESRCCVLMVRHLNSRQSRRAMYRGAGSIGILGACRTGLIVERHPDDPERRVLAMTKSNLGPQAASLGFRVRTKPEHAVERRYPAGLPHPETFEKLKEAATFTYTIPAAPVVEWEGVSPLTADDLCLARPDATGPGLRAAAWLKKVLANGPVAATEIVRRAAEEGFGYRTVKVAKARLKIESERVVEDGHARWEWMLPPEPE